MKLLERFRKKKLTEKVGDGPAVEIENKYYLCFPTLEGEPTFELKDSLTIGSEVGDIILEDEAISPRHCTVTHNQDVISIMDHNSTTGTFIGKKELGAGRMYILQENDKVKLGDIPMELLLEEVEVPLKFNSMPESMPEQTADLPAMDALQTQNIQLDQDRMDEIPAHQGLELEQTDLMQNVESEPELEVEEGVLDLTRAEALDNEEEAFKVEINPTSINKTKSSLRIKNAEPAPEASSALIRILGLLCDVLIVLITYNLLSPYDAFTMFLTDFPLMIWGWISPYYQADLAPMVEQFLTDYPAVREMLKDFTSHLDDYIVGAQLLFVFAMLRIVTTLIFGVSLGQALVGIRAYGNMALKRILGGLREFIGIFTLPFIIFDLATIFNIRSFKEIVTFSRITTPYLGRSIIASIVVLPVLMITYLLSPMFQGLEFREPYVVISSGFKPAKKVELDASYMTSEYMQLSVSLDEKLKLYPSFEFSKKGNRTLFHPSLILRDVEKGKTYELSKKKKFDLKKLISIAFGINPLAKLNYPELAKYLYDVSSTNKNFTRQNMNKLEFAQEFKNLMITSMELGPAKVVDHILEHGPLMKGFVDFRDSLYQMLGGNIKGVEIHQLGDSYFAFFEMNAPRGFEFKFIPLVAEDGAIYSITTDERGFTTKAIQKILSKSIWSEVKNADEDRVNYLRFIDKISSEQTTTKIDSMNDSSLNMLQNMLQKFYQKMFTDIQQSLENDPEGIKIWEQSLIRTLKVLDAAKLKEEDSLSPWSKFYQNISDVLQALREKDLEFFNLNKKV